MKLKEKLLIANLKNARTKEKAFSALLDKFQEPLYWHIRKIVNSHDDANDVLQNTFIRVFRSIDNFKGKSSLKTWLFRIAYNESIRLINSRSSNTSSIDDEDTLSEVSQDAHFDGNEADKKLKTLLSQLTLKQRNIFQMKYFDDLSFREIAEITDENESTIKSSYYSSVKYIEKKITQ